MILASYTVVNPMITLREHRQRRPTYAQGIAFAEYVQKLADVGRVSQSYAANVWDWAHNRKDVTDVTQGL